MPNQTDQHRSLRGFAAMDQSKQREIASKGGKAAHAQGRAHEFTPDEARRAGRKGGEVVSRDRAHMAAIGREGGQARGRAHAAARAAAAAAAATAASNSTGAQTPSPSENQREEVKQIQN